MDKSRDQLEEELKSIASAKGENAVELVPVIEKMAGLTHRGGDAEAAKTLYERNIRILERAWISPENRIALMRMHHSLGLLHRLRLEFVEAEPHYKNALQLAEQHFGEHHLETAVRRNYLAGLYFAAKKYKDAEKLLATNLQLYEQVLGKEDKVTAIALYGLAIVSRRSSLASAGTRKVHVAETEMAPVGRWQGYYQQSARILNIDIWQLSMNDSQELFLALIRLSHDAFADERFEEAEELFRHSLLLELEGVWPQHPLVGNSYRLLADLCRSAGVNHQSEQLYNRALSINEKGYGADHEKVAATAFAMGTLLREQGRNIEAESMLKRSCDIYRRSGAFPPLLGNSLRAYSAVLQALGRDSEAQSLLKEAEAIFDKFGDRSHNSQVT
jgi:tetratricopeptide (TPR) repeat protein